MAFHSVVFDKQYSQGAVGGPEFQTTVVTLGSGYEQRNVDWASPRCRWDVSRLLHDPSTRDGMLAFFRARKGRAHAFLFYDHADCDVGMDWVDNIHVHTGAHNFAVGDGVEDTFQLEKVYDSGGFYDRRRITRPASPIKVYINDVEVVSGWSVDYDTGILTFTSPVANSDDIGWSGEFYVPSRFDVDHIPMNYTSATAADVSLTIVEVRE